MISGGDLDGDQFFVTWEWNLFFFLLKNFFFDSWDENLIHFEPVAPMDYSSAALKEAAHEISVEDLKEYLLDSVFEDMIGKICNQHLVKKKKNYFP